MTTIQITALPAPGLLAALDVRTAQQSEAPVADATARFLAGLAATHIPLVAFRALAMGEEAEVDAILAEIAFVHANYQLHPGYAAGLDAFTGWVMGHVDFSDITPDVEP